MGGLDGFMRSNLRSFVFCCCLIIIFFFGGNMRCGIESFRVVKRMVRTWNDRGSGGRLEGAGRRGSGTSEPAAWAPGRAQRSRNVSGIPTEYDRRRGKVRARVGRRSGVNRLTSRFSQSCWRGDSSCFSRCWGTVFCFFFFSLNYGGWEGARDGPATALRTARRGGVGPARPAPFSPRPLGPPRPLWTPPPARRSRPRARARRRIPVNMVGLAFVLGLVLPLIQRAHTRAGEAAQLGPTPVRAPTSRAPAGPPAAAPSGPRPGLPTAGPESRRFRFLPRVGRREGGVCPSGEARGVFA